MNAISTFYKSLSSRVFNRNFFLYWCSNTMSDIGDAFHSVALGFWVMTTTHNILDLSILMVAKVVPSVILSPIAGTLADKMDKRKIMKLMHLFQFMIVGLIAFLVTKGDSTQIVYSIMFLTFFSGVFKSISEPARQSALVRLVEKDDIPQATAFQRFSSTLVMVCGPMLGGVIVAVIGSAKTLLIDSVSFLLAALIINLVVMNHTKQQKEGSQEKGQFWRELKEGLTFVYSSSPINLLVILNNILNIFGVAQGILMAALAVNVWKVGSVGYGLVEASFPIGMVIGAAIIMKLPKIRKRGIWICAAYAVAGIFGIIIPFNDNLLFAIPFLAIDGALTVMAALLVNIIFRVYIDPDMQGRVFGIYGSVASVATPMGALIGGVLADSVGIFEGAVGIGIAFAIVPIIMYIFSPKLRAID